MTLARSGEEREKSAMWAKLRRQPPISNRRRVAWLLQKGAARMDLLSRALVLLVFLQAFSLTPV